MTLFHKGSSDIETLDFYRIREGSVSLVQRLTPSKRARRSVFLAPLKSLSVSSYSFPFGNVLRVREALRIQSLPYGSAGSMELFPTAVEKSARACSGVVWYVSVGELDFQLPSGNVENLVWPAPLPLVSKVGGEGLTVWADEENVCSLFWKNGLPMLYRWRPRGKTTPEAELAWFESYCQSQGQVMGEAFVLDATKPEELTSLPAVAEESLTRYPWIGSVNLSRSALFSAMGLERSVRLLCRVAGWTLILGFLVLAGNLLRLNQVQKDIEKTRELASALYKETFEPDRTERVSDPLGQARERLAELRGGGSEGRAFGEVLEELGSIFRENPSMDVTVDTLRYNAEGLDCTGSAPDMTTVLSFRKAWESRAALAQLDNTQNVPGLGYRFDLRVRDKGPGLQQ